MYVEFKRLSYKNFLSSGKTFTDIDFLKSHISLIVGKNGAGKSSMVTALLWCLYSKINRDITKKQLVNSINKKNLVVECEFSINSHDYKVIRGIKPDIFEVYKDSNLIPRVADNKVYQKNLEEILGIDYNTCNQIIIVSKGNFTPFMKLKPDKRRLMVEDIMSIKILSIMKNILKDKFKNHNTLLKDMSSKVYNSSSLLNMAMSYSSKRKDDFSVLIDEKNKSISKIEEEYENYIKYEEFCKNEYDQVLLEKTEYNKNSEEVNNLNSRIRKGEMFISSIETEIKNLNKNKNFFEENTSCPVCGQELEESHRAKHIEEYSTALNSKSDLLVRSKEKIEKLKILVNEINEKLFKYEAHEYDAKSKLDLADANTKTCKSKLNTAKNELQRLINKSEEPDKTYDIKKLKSDVDKNKNSFEDEKINDDVFKYGDILLRDDGIKAKIISKYIPVMNSSINKYLEQMGLFCLFTFDDNFEEHMMSRYRDDFSYGSFSEGEKQRIDLAILLTWRDIAKKRAGTTTNLLIFDEVTDGSGDAECNDALIKIIDEMDGNVFVISHSEDTIEKLHDSRIIKFSKDHDFSVKEEI